MANQIMVHLRACAVCNFKELDMSPLNSLKDSITLLSVNHLDTKKTELVLVVTEKMAIQWDGMN